MSETDFEKIVVLGAGAVGSLFGAMLREGGFDVTLVSRNVEHVDAINMNGLVVKTPADGGGEEDSVTIKADTKLSGEPDLIILAVKAYDVESALASVRDFACPVLCIQNGIGVEEIAAKVIGAERVVRGVTFMGATFAGPGCVVNAGIGETLIGRGKHSEKIAEVFSRSGLSTNVTDNITGVVWTKSLVNCGMNAFGALTGLRNGELAEVPGLIEAMIATVEEGAAVAEPCGVKIEGPQEKLLDVAELTAKNKNSMLQDIERGKRTEIDFLNGAVSRIGKEKGVPTPLNDVLTALVKGLEFKKRQARKAGL